MARSNTAPILTVEPGDRHSLDMRKRPGAPKRHVHPVIQNPCIYSDMTEHQIQAALFRAYKARRTPWAVMFAIPNGGARDAVTGKLLRDEGVTAGAPDIFCSVGYRLYEKYGPFLLEIKTVDGRLSAAQKKFHPMLVTAGVEVIVCRGFLEAIAVLEERGIIRPPKVNQVIHDKGNEVATAKAAGKGKRRSDS